MEQSTSENVLAQSENILSWRYWFGEIDTRWLSVFRIFFGLLLLKDAIYHLPLARIFYSDFGVIPRWALFDGLVRDKRFSLMDAMGQPWMAFLFFCLWIIVLIFLIIGYRSRLMTILNFIIILSVHERNGYILTSADTLMRAMSFWMMFAPIGQYYAIDAIRRRWRRFRETGEVTQLRVEAAPRIAFALPMRLIQIQLVIVYIATAYLKIISPIWQRGETMHYIAQIETFILPFGVWMRTWSPESLRLLSFFSMYAEIAIPILLLLPFVWRWSRLLAFILAMMLHGGIAVTMSIPDFSILMLICYLPFFDTRWLSWLESRFKRARQAITLPKPVDLYSPLWVWLSLTSTQEMTLSDETQATFVVHHDTDEIISPQEILKEQKKLFVEEYDNWEIRIEGETIQGKSAWQAMTAHLAFSRFWNWSLNIKPLRLFIWRIMRVIVNHYRNKRFTPKTQSQGAWLQQRIRLSIVLLPLFLLLIMFNIETTGRYREDGFQYPRPVQSFWDNAQNVIWYSGLWQYWDMFSPTPIQYDGWLIIEGQFENGFRYDLVTGEAVDYDTPTRWYWGSDMRWEKFEENVFQGRHDALLRGWGSYYCHTLNEDRVQGTQLATLEITMLYTNFHAPNEFPHVQQNEQLWFHWCFDEFAPQS